MLIQVLSDLHLEMVPCDIPTLGDVVVLAGDIHIGTAGIRWAQSQFPDVPVIYVAGNHEYYYHHFPDLLEPLRAEAKGSNVHVLENDSWEHEGIRFMGATLWTDFAFNGLSRQDMNMSAAKRGMNDFCMIRKADDTRLLPPDIASYHRRSRDWLRRNLAISHPGPTLVVTHHAPCIMSTHPYNRFASLTPAYVNNLEPLIQEFQPDAWISGHTHYCTDYRIGETRLVSNQRGYGDHDIKEFQPNYVIEV